MTAAAVEDRDRVGPYRVLQAIGAGGSARIDLARIDRAYGFHRHVVIKRPLEHLRDNTTVAESLRREARIGGQLRHPNLVAVLDAGVHDDYDYLVLEYIHGAALRTVMQTETSGQVRRLPIAVALAIVADVARGMHEAHELTDEHGEPLGLVHRDISPGNILVGLDGAVKLADFGIAKETRVSTLSGSMTGTVTYMAPEQCQGYAFDRRADVFSLGVILFELVTGARLFWADNDVASLHRVLSGAVPRPRALRPEIPAALEDILLTAVAHQPEQRYATALELAGAIERYAAAAGEVLGARWIARTMAEVVGPLPAPWVTAPRQPEAAPSADASLVELIASLGADEPVETAFGDNSLDEPASDHAAETPASARPVSQAVAPALPMPPARRRRRRRPLVAIIAAGAVLGSAATGILMTRGPDSPATISQPLGPTPSASAARPAAGPPPSINGLPAASPAREPASSEPAPSLVAEPPQAASPAATASDSPTVPPVDRSPPQRAEPPARAATASPTTPKRRPHPTRPREPAAPVAATPPEAPAPAAGSAAPAAPATAPRPAATVEWKPTLLWPSESAKPKADK